MRNSIRTYKFEIMIYIIIFSVFFYIFMTVPPVCDRLMEGVVLNDLKNPLYYIFGQIRWFQVANARIISNLFSVIVDYNIIFRALCDASMMVGISYFVFDVTNASIKSRVIYLVCLFLVSWGIQKEVYFYATTLYIGGIFIVTCIYWIFNREHEINKLVLFLLVLVGSTWLESISLMIIAIMVCLFIREYYCGKRNVLRNVLLILESVLGFLIMFLSSRLADNGRLNKRGGLINISGTHIENLIFQNVGLLIVLAIILCFITRENINSRQPVAVIHYTYWLIVTVVLLLWASEGIYKVISKDPENIWAGDVIAWRNFHYDFFDKFYEEFDCFVHFFWPIAVVISLLSVLYIFYKNKKICIGIETMIIMIAGGMIDLLGIQNGDRIVFPAFFMLIVLNVILCDTYDRKMSEKNRFFITVVLISIVGFIQFENVNITLENATKVADMRWKIADEIRLQQGVNRWDYDDVAVMPSYDEDGLPGEVNNQPEINTLRYYIMLKYYNLDENTKIIFE